MIHRRAFMGSTALGVAGLGTAVGAWAKGAESALPGVGSVLRLPDVKLLDGRLWSPLDKATTALVVYWWASWCPFCALQSPHIQALWQAQKANGLGLLALSIDPQASAAGRYLRSKGYSFPTGMLMGEVAKMLPKPKGLPVLAVLKVAGREGTVVFAESGEMFPEDIEGLKRYL